MISAYTLRHATSSQSPIGDAGRMEKKQIHHIISNSGFSLLFQRVVRLADRHIDHHEALLRLSPPRAVAVTSPTTFLGMIREHQLVESFDLAVLNTASRVSLPVSVNVHARSLLECSVINALLHWASLGRPVYAIELVDVPAVPDIAHLISVIGELRAAGTKVTLDDCDHLPQALNLLQNTHLDMMKIAMPAIRSAGGRTRSRRLLSEFAALAALTGAVTVVKRVETLPQAWALQEMGIELAQGWLFGAPQPLREQPDGSGPAALPE
jgi:EAL domain-containing protein (putative c-di-GMP-specific phosphodiesterase class I)